MKRITLILIALLVTIGSCNSQSCNDLPVEFSSYQEALAKIKSINFTIEESVNTLSSSLIKSVSYYSCDSKLGFLLVKMKSTEYIYQNVPISVWDNFKQANSFGSFYNYNIKGKYQLII